MNDDRTAIISDTTNYTARSSGFIGLSTYSNTTSTESETYLDWILLRKVTTTEPSINIGSASTLYASDSPSVYATSDGLTVEANTTLTGFSTTATTNGGAIGYQLTRDGGSSWLYWNGSAWTSASDSFSQSNSASVVDANLSAFSVLEGDSVKVKSYLNSDGSQLVQLDEITLTYEVADSDSTGSNESTQDSISTPTPPQCQNQPPGEKAPSIYSASALDSSTIRIYFSSAADPVESYSLVFGTSPGNYQYGLTKIGDGSTRTFDIKELKPGTTYYFKVIPTNGCATGNWSNEISASTLSLSKNLLKKNLVLNSSDHKSTTFSNEEVIESSNQEQTSNLAPDNEPSKVVDGAVISLLVVDKTGKPVSGAQVTLHSTPKVSTTNEEGLVVFDNVESGDHKIFITYANYEGEQSLYVDADTKKIELTIALSQKNSFLNPYVILTISFLVITIAFLLYTSTRKIKS